MTVAPRLYFLPRPLAAVRIAGRHARLIGSVFLEKDPAIVRIGSKPLQDSQRIGAFRQQCVDDEEPSCVIGGIGELV